MKTIILSSLLSFVLAANGVARSPHPRLIRNPAAGPVLEVSSTEHGLLLKVSRRKHDPHPFREVELKGAENGIIYVTGDDDRYYLLSRDQRTCAYGIKHATKAHELNAIRATLRHRLRVYDAINLDAGEQILRTKRGRKTFGDGVDLGWAYFTSITNATVSFRAGVWTGEDGKLKHFTCTVRLLPDSAIKVTSWKLENG